MKDHFIFLQRLNLMWIIMHSYIRGLYNKFQYFASFSLIRRQGSLLPAKTPIWRFFSLIGTSWLPWFHYSLTSTNLQGEEPVLYNRTRTSANQMETKAKWRDLGLALERNQMRVRAPLLLITVVKTCARSFS
jgi:hypothetical protein